MIDDRDLRKLARLDIPPPSTRAREDAISQALRAFQQEKIAAAAQGSQVRPRLSDRALKLWSDVMNTRLLSTSTLAGLIALPIAGYTAFHLLQDRQPLAPFGAAVEERNAVAEEPAQPPVLAKEKDEAGSPATLPDAQPPAAMTPAGQLDAGAADDARKKSQQEVVPAAPQPQAAAQPEAEAAATAVKRLTLGVAPRRQAGQEAATDALVAPAPFPSDAVTQAENRDRIADFKSNPVTSTAEQPVSTFSIDVDTASYSYVRRSLKEGQLPQADTVRVEEMVNYFPYDWKRPDTAETPFDTTVSVMPTPWNEHTRLMHVAIKGYDLQPAVRPKANLVFLIDVSGSMDEPDKLPLLRSAFRMLVNTLQPADTVSIVTYAGDAGTVLEPTKASDKDKILNAIDTLTPGGSTAGEAGIREAYRLAQQSFVKDGVNRVMLATDGDFNVGQSNDDDLKRLVEEKRKSGVLLSVFGFGRGNLNDRMMQTIAQNGNGTAAYIDTLQEAEKVLVEDASSTLFPIAKDVKIQVEFNPAKVSEYRLIGYETRSLAREDFNDDRVDAGEIGSGHSVTAIYEVTPRGSPAQQIDDLRYGQATVNNPEGVANAGEYAFVKIRYKLPEQDISRLITQPVTASNEVTSFQAAGADQRFSVAVAAFGQKLRGEAATATFSYDRIGEIAAAARGPDPFGYRSEFLSLVRLASALDGARR